jgi:peptidoglycan-N-acetylglucosamine deacetylase
VAIRPFIYLAAAGMTVGLLIGAGHVLGQMAAGRTEPVAAPPVAAAPAAAVARTATPTPRPTAAPTPTPKANPLQAVGIQPQIKTGGGPYGSVVGTGSNTVALTFDDGPDPEWTPKVLEVLRNSGVKATFCLVGQNVQAYPDLVRAIVAEGHTLCNHSWDHDESLGQLGKAAIRADMKRASAAIEAAVPGAPISYFRAPGGNWTASLVSVSRELGMTPLSWTVDPRDWARPPVASIVRTITSSCETGAIFLLHDGGGNRSNTVEAVRSFLPALSRTNAFVALPTGSA